MSSCNKTPVAVLHELCVRRGVVEQYKVVAIHGTPNERIFETSVKTDTGIIACGSGKTKKEAKHNAAKAALNKLNVPAITSGVQMRGEQDTPSVVNPHAVKGLTGNAVGRLQEYCVTNGLPAPVYQLIGDEGEPHERTFSWKCEVSKRYEIGIGRTKKVAKHNAAQAMYETLINNPSLCMRDRLPTAEGNLMSNLENPANLSQEEKENIAKQYSLNRPFSNVPVTSPGLKFSQYHEEMENTLLPVKDKLNTSTFPSPIETLNELAERLGLSVSFHRARRLDRQPDEEEWYMYAAVNSQPVTVQVGEGHSESSAMVNAALNVLQYWQNFVDVSPVI